MRILANRYIRRLLLSVTVVSAVFTILLELIVYIKYGDFSLFLLCISLIEGTLIMMLCIRYFKKEDEILSDAALRVNRFLKGHRDERIECDEEGELFCLFQSVNTLSAVLNAKAEREKQTNEFLKSTISDISHQLKTPLAALSIYNDLISDADEMEDIKRFAAASEAEIDRMNELVKNLLKITRLDAGVIAFEKHPGNMADIMENLKQRFAYRAEAEEKEIRLSGGEDIFPCDAGWLTEAFGNIVKNALDHTSTGGIISIEWEKSGNIMNVTIRDNGSGIHPEDMNHIFKRFYRSRFSKDTHGIGLGLPLAKTIIEAHNGIIEVESELGHGTTFFINFLIPTEL